MLKIFKFDNTKVDKEISRLEEKYRISLPQDYRNFSIKYNGGYTPKTTFKIEKTSSDIRAFFGFSGAPRDYNFAYIETTNFFEDILENGYMPIATDSFGNFIVLSISEGKPEICFFDSELQSYQHLTDDLETFFEKINSKKFVVRSIEERIQGMKDSGSDIEADDELISIWQGEINKYSDKKQEKVLLQ